MAPSKPSIHYKYIHVSMMLNADGNDVENEDNNLMIINREAHAPSVGKYGENNALEQPPQDRKHIL